MSSNTPPGWYDDGQGGRRWWDGARWAAPGQGPAAPAPGLDKPAGPPSPPPSHPPTQQLPQQPAYGAPAGAPPGQQYPAGQPGSPYGQPGTPPGQPYGAPGGQPGSPYGPPGGLGAYPGAGAPRRGRTGLVLAIVGGLVALGVLALVLFLVLGGSDGPSSDDPAETVQAFVDASRDGDCDALDELVTDNARRLTAGCGQDTSTELPDGSSFDLDDVEVEVGDATEDGDSATVPVTVSGSGLPSSTIDYRLVRTDGAWLVDGLDIAGLPEVPGLPTDGLPTDGLPSLDPGDLPTEGFPTEGLPEGFPTEGLPFDPGEIPTDPEDLQSYLEDLESFFPTDIPT